ncbi:MAG: HAD hydrolase-like protein [Anaerolineales bacterium]
MLYIFDLDTTLVTKYTSDPLPNVLEKLQALRAAGHDLAVATNQGGLAWGAWTGRAKYPTITAMATRFIQIVRLLPPLQGAHWFVAVYDERVRLALERFEALAEALTEAGQEIQLHAAADPEWRKPRSGMLRAACRLYGVAPEEALYVGDMETDAEAAGGIGMPFAYAADFFERQPELE